MGLHSGRANQLRRHRESLGHVKLSFANLEELVSRWEKVCGHVIITVGDGLTADYVEDLIGLDSGELDNLVIRTENPALAITLRRNKAEISYFENPAEMNAINSIRNSLTAFKILVPYYRLKAFWAWVYSLLLIFAIFVGYKFQSSRPPPLLPAPTTPLIHGAPPPPLPPPPLAFPTLYMMIALVTFVMVTGWLVNAYSKIASQSSTRVIRRK